MRIGALTKGDSKGEKQKWHIHPGGSARPAGYGWHFAHAVIQTKGNSNEDSAAGRVRVLRGADARRGRHRRVAETRLSATPRTIHLHLAEQNDRKKVVDGYIRRFPHHIYRGEK